LAAVILLSSAIGLYMHRNAEKTDEIIITGAAGDVQEPSAGEAGADGTGAADGSGAGEGSEEPAPEAAPATIVVDVGGAVANPTVLIMPEGSRVYEALESAGGLLPQADMREINRATVLKDGDRIYIPDREEAASKSAVPPSAGGGASAGVTNATGTSGSTESGGGGALININTADSQELQRLSGVGPSTAQKILDYREANGRFGRIEDIKKVSGIGDKTFEKFKAMLAVD
jgi:competence protein ComEA